MPIDDRFDSRYKRDAYRAHIESLVRDHELDRITSLEIIGLLDTIDALEESARNQAFHSTDSSFKST